MEDQLTHLDDEGQANMIDIGAKPETERIAVAEGKVFMQSATLRLIHQGLMKKGDIIGVARIAGIMGAKKTSDLIPLCHPLSLTKIDVQVESHEEGNYIHIVSTARTVGKTGVEMEALTAVSIAALTIYDMAKAVDREMQIGDIRLLEKRGGMRGDYVAKTME